MTAESNVLWYQFFRRNTVGDEADVMSSERLFHSFGTVCLLNLFQYSAETDLPDNAVVKRKTKFVMLFLDVG